MAERINQEGIAFVPDIMLPRLLGDTSFRDRCELVEEVRNWILAQDAGAIAAAAIGMAEREDARPTLSSIKVPVLAIAGQQDSAHEDTRAIAENVRNGQFVSIPRAGHLSNLEQPEKFNTRSDAVSSGAQTVTAFLADPISKRHEPGPGHPESPARFDAVVKGLAPFQLTPYAAALRHR